MSGESVNRESHLGLFGNGSDVGLIDLSNHLHFRQIVGDQEQDRCLEAGCHRLADVHVAFDHHPVNGRDDVRIIKVYLSHLQFGLGLFDVGLNLFFLSGCGSNGRLDLADLSLGLLQPCGGLVHAGLGRFQVPLGNQTVLKQSFGSSQLPARFLMVHPCHQKIGLGAQEFGLAVDQIGLRVLDRGFRRGQGSGGTIPLGLEVGGVDDGQGLSFLDHTVEIRMQFLDAAGDLTADLNGDYCLERSGRGNGSSDIATLYFNLQVLFGGVDLPLSPHQEAQNCQDENPDDQENRLTLQCHGFLPFQDAWPPRDQT